jgi:hypothetical protein
MAANFRRPWALTVLAAMFRLNRKVPANVLDFEKAAPSRVCRFISAAGLHGWPREAQAMQTAIRDASDSGMAQSLFGAVHPGGDGLISQPRG